MEVGLAFTLYAGESKIPFPLLRATFEAGLLCVSLPSVPMKNKQKCCFSCFRYYAASRMKNGKCPTCEDPPLESKKFVGQEDGESIDEFFDRKERKVWNLS